MAEQSDVKNETEEGKPQPATTRSFLKVAGADVTGRKHPTNYFETLMHVVKGNVGTGIFAMGDAFKNSGLVLGPTLLTAVTLICLHCQHLLVRAAVKVIEKEPVEVLPSYAETVKYTFEDSPSKKVQRFSRSFGIMTDVFICIAEYGFCVVYFIFISQHLCEVAHANGWEVSYREMLAIVFTPMWISTFLTNLKLLMPMSFLANILQWFGIAMIVYFTCLDLGPIEKVNFVAEYDRFPRFVGTVLFAFEGITFIMNVRMEMKNKRLFTTFLGVLNVAWLIVNTLYTAVGFFAFWSYGEEAKGSAFLNMPQDDLKAQITKVLVSISILFTYTLHMYIPFEVSFPIFNKRWGPFKRPLLVMTLYRTFWVVITYALANISEKLNSVISLVGALTGSVLALILPALLELAMLQGNLSPWTIIKDTLIIILGIIGAIAGTTISIVDIIKEYTEADKKS